MNPRIFLRIHPQENRENVEKSEFSKVRNETFRQNLTPFILKINRRNGAVTGLKPNKKGDRESLSPLHMVAELIMNEFQQPLTAPNFLLPLNHAW